MLPLLLLLLPTKENGNNNIFYFKLYVITGPEDAYKSGATAGVDKFPQSLTVVSQDNDHINLLINNQDVEHPCQEES